MQAHAAEVAGKCTARNGQNAGTMHQQAIIVAAFRCNGASVDRNAFSVIVLDGVMAVGFQCTSVDYHVARVEYDRGVARAGRLEVAAVDGDFALVGDDIGGCLLYTSPSPRDRTVSVTAFLKSMTVGFSIAISPLVSGIFVKS